MKAVRSEVFSLCLPENGVNGELIANQLIEIAGYLRCSSAGFTGNGPVRRISDHGGLLDVAEQELRRLRLRKRYLARDVPGDGLWAMLLDLFLCHYRGERVSTKAACIAADVPQRTAMRWLNDIERDGLIARSACRADKRVKYVSLTAKGHLLVNNILLAYGDDERRALRGSTECAGGAVMGRSAAGH